MNEAFRTFQEWKMQFPNPFTRITQSEDSVGDYLDQAKHCVHCFEVAMGAQDCSYCHFAGLQSKDLMDCTMVGEGSELLYEMSGASRSQRCMSVCFCNSCSETYYCDMVNSCEHCFGCIGLRHKKYCILNKQYTKEEYEQIVPTIIERMTADKEWGEHFPVSLSPFAYNETVAAEFYPLSKEEALQRGFLWKDTEENRPQSDSESKAKEVRTCTECKRSYRIIPQELSFYEGRGLPLPQQCPECRHTQRMNFKNPPFLWDRQCQKCGKGIQTSYAPDRPEIIYCEKCYLTSVY